MRTYIMDGTFFAYTPLNVKFSYDNFVVGLVRPRDGVLESLTLADVNGDVLDDIIVIMRNVGSGSYLAADAIEFKGG